MVQLGKTNIKLSPITLGTFAIGGTMWGGNDEKNSIDAIHASLDNGVTSIDTAPVYGFGLSDEVIGKAIKRRDRSEIQLLAKFGLVWDGSNNKKGEYFFEAKHNGKPVSIYRFASKENVIKEVEENLKRLNTDYIDVFQIHWPDNSTPISETMEALEILIQQGKIRDAGVSNFNIKELEEAKNITGLASNQVAYSMLNKEIEKEVIPFALKNDIGIIAYSPMERGLLTGKYFNGIKLKEEDHRNGYFQQFNMDKVASFVNLITPIAESKQVSLAQLVLSWTIHQKGITVALAGARNTKQAESNAAAMSLKLSQSDLNNINDLLTVSFKE